MSEENAGAFGAGAGGDRENAGQLRPSAGAHAARYGFLPAFVVLVAALSLFGPLASSGIWDPPEREVAELARRIGLNLLGGHQLSLDGADNRVPIRSELGRGELPFTSIAVGFRLFGLREWAGRLPLATWAAIGLAATYFLVRRLADRRSAWFSVLVLSTMPLYFLHARTMLGDIVTMAALAVAAGGLGLAVFERGGPVSVGRWLALGLGISGLVCALFSRGALIGIAVPAGSVGLTWLVLRAAQISTRDRFGDSVGVLALAVGLGAGIGAFRALLQAPESGGGFSLWLGSVVNRPRVLPTFDSVLLQLGHALFPWSAVLPVALGSLLREPPAPEGPARERETALRCLCLLLPLIAFGAYGVAAPILGSMPFAAVSALAVAIALFARDFERGAKISRALPMVACAFAILLLVDFRNFPEKGLSAFCVSDAHFPDSFRGTAERWLSAGTLIFCGAFFFLLQERSTARDARFELGEYRAWPRVLRELWAGNLLFSVVVIEAALVGLCVLGWLSERVLAPGTFESLSALQRSWAAEAAVALPASLAVPLLLRGVRDAFRTLFDPELGAAFGAGAFARSLSGGLSRAQWALIVCAGFGLCLSLGYYPMLAAQISPKQVFDAYRRRASPGEPLGMLGAGAASATYYAGRSVQTFDSPAQAYEWLSASDKRRWLAIRAADLASLNALYRASNDPPKNLPVLDDSSSEILLASNRLEGAINQNPLESYVLERAPTPQRALSANLGDKLDVLGWDTLDLEGHPVDAVDTGRKYEFVIYYRVVQPISGSWETFVHVDGFQRRFNGDHPTLAGKYPFNLWRAGDFIADRSEFTLERSFAPGKYRVYFGLYSGNRRLEVRRGPAEENRLEAGFLQVR